MSDPSAIFQMLATQFLQPGEMPQAPMPNKTAIPNFAPQSQDSQFIDLGAGGTAPGAQRSNWLSSLGGAAQQLAPLIGSAMASSQPQNAASAMKNSPGQMTLTPPNAPGTMGGYAFNLPALPSKR
jgi:hypothetical protein